MGDLEGNAHVAPLKSKKKKKKKMNLGKIPFDIDFDFHPSNNLVATTLINGDLHLYRFSLDSVPGRQLEVHEHTDSCRVARFIDCGRVLLTASSDCSILATDVETPIDNVHEAGENRLINLTEATVVSPDDVGFIKIWDIRKCTCCNYFNVHENYISDMTSMKLLTTSEDDTLSVYDLRTNTVQSRSVMSELLSVVLMKNGRNFVYGSQSGIILYSWGCFKNFSHAGISMYMDNSIDAMFKLDENRIITGTENGIFSLVVVQPIADSEYPVEYLGNTQSQSASASASASDSIPTFASTSNNDSALTLRMLSNISKRVINGRILMEAIYKAKTAKRDKTANKDKSTSTAVFVLASALASTLTSALVSSTLTSALTSAFISVLTSSLTSVLTSALTVTLTPTSAPRPASRMLHSINEGRIVQCKRVINRKVFIEAIYKAMKANKDK